MAQELSDKIRAAAQAKGIDPEIALRIARAESAVNPAAQAKTSSAGGLFQVVDKTWKEFGGKPGKKYDPDENIRVGTDIISSNTNYLKKVLNRDPRPAEIYAAHYFGPTGAKSFLTADPATPIVDILGKAAVKANPNLQGKTAGQVLTQLETKMGQAPKQPDVSRETPAPAARPPLPESLPPMAQAPAQNRMADLGPSYQAALALSFLADTDEKEERDIDREPGIAEKWLAEQPAAPSVTAQFADVSIKSPFAQPQQPKMLAGGGMVQHMSGGGLPFVPTARVSQSARRELDAMKTGSDQYNKDVEAYNKATEAWNAGPRDQDFTMAEPVAPSFTQETYNAKALAARRDAQNRSLALQVAADPKRFGLSMDRLFADGGEVELTPEEIAAASRPATVNPNIQRQGEAARRLAAMRDVNTLPDPRTYAAVSGFLGTPPDQQGFSAMHPDLQGIKKAGETGFYTGTALQVAPVAGKAAQMLGKLTGSALNERMLAGQSLTPGFNTPAPINFAVKPRGGTFAYTPEDTARAKPISDLAKLVRDYGTEARDLGAGDEVLEFLKAKAPKYFTSSYGTADDPLRTAIRDRRIEPFGRDKEKIKPYLVDAAANPEGRDQLGAKIDLERAYDDQTGIRAFALKPENAPSSFERDMGKSISAKMGEEGVPIEARNLPDLNSFSPSEFELYPTSSTLLRRLVENQENIPTNIQQALRTGETVYDARPGFSLLSPTNVIEALQQVPANKLKNMSFPEALIQGTQALAPVRDYLSAVALAEKGAKVPRKALDMFTTPVVEAPSFGGQWVTLDKSVAAKMEGKLMNHSVGDYNSGTSYGTAYTGLPYGGKKAFDEGLVRVYSLRDDQGLPKVTVEMAKSDGGKGNTWNVSQIRGRFNSEPLPEAREDIFRLLGKVDAQDGLNIVKQNSYSKLPTGETGPGTVVDWGREYDLWKQSAE